MHTPYCEIRTNWFCTVVLDICTVNEYYVIALYLSLYGT